MQKAPICPGCGKKMLCQLEVCYEGDRPDVCIAHYECDCGWSAPSVRRDDATKAIEASYHAASREMAPVVHARWGEDDYGNTVCTGCGKHIPSFPCCDEETDEEWDEEIDQTPFCPNCGAKMDGGA